MVDFWVCKTGGGGGGGGGGSAGGTGSAGGADDACDAGGADGAGDADGIGVGGFGVLDLFFNLFFKVVICNGWIITIGPFFFSNVGVFPNVLLDTLLFVLETSLDVVKFSKLIDYLQFLAFNWLYNFFFYMFMEFESKHRIWFLFILQILIYAIQLYVHVLQTYNFCSLLIKALTQTNNLFLSLYKILSHKTYSTLSMGLDNTITFRRINIVIIYICS